MTTRAEVPVLRPRQQRFVAEYMVDLNATQAAIRAGYSKRTAKSVGHENLTKPDIAAAIETGQKVIAEGVGLSADWVVQRLMEIVDCTMQRVPVLGKDGRATGQWQFEAAHAINALRELGKHLPGFYPTERNLVPVEITGQVQVSNESVLRSELTAPDNLQKVAQILIDEGVIIPDPAKGWKVIEADYDMQDEPAAIDYRDLRDQ